jgi:hypothetical protein
MDGHTLLNHNERHQGHDSRGDKPEHDRREPAHLPTVAQEKIDPGDPQRDQGASGPVHPARGRAAGFAGGHRLPGEREGSGSDYQG